MDASRKLVTDVSAVIVTRGDVDLMPILSGLPFEDVVIWDNSKRPQDVSVWGRYLAIAEAHNDIVFVQDDDCLVDAAAVVEHYRPDMITTNVPEARRAPLYTRDVTLVGWGSVFHRDFTTCFQRYLRAYPNDDLFRRECDRVFTGLNRWRNIDVRLEHLPHAYAENRLGAEKRHLVDLATITERIRDVVANVPSRT